MTGTDAQIAREHWWADWWRGDFSWEGLGKRRAAGWYIKPNGRMTRDRTATPRTRPATLKDVWKSEAGRLVTGPDLRQWTVVHAPLAWANQAAAKSGWTADEVARIDQALADAIARFPAEQLGAPAVEGPPKPRMTKGSARTAGFPLDGAVLIGLPAPLEALPLLRGDQIAVTGERMVNLGARSQNLRFPLFEPLVSIDGEAETPQTVDWVRAIAMRGLVLSDTKPAAVHLRGLTTFGPVDVDFVEIAGQLNLQGMRAAGDVSCEDVKAGQIDLIGSRIAGELRLHDIDGDVRLARTVIEGAVGLHTARCAKLSASDMTVNGSAVFADLHVTDFADLTNTSWGKAVSFKGARFGPVVFGGADFAGKAVFSNVSFRERVSFMRAHFHDSADFSASAWPAAIGDQDGAFREVRFDSFVDFQDANFRAFSAFNGATFKSEIRFDRAILKGYAVIREALDHARTDGQRIALEHGLRALKQAAESVRDRNLEQALFRYELIARRSQSDVSLGEKTMSWIYGAISRYGSSSWRPVAVAVGLWLSFGLGYLWLGRLAGAGILQDLSFWGDRWHPALPDALALSARSMFNLFGIWTVRVPDVVGEPTISHLFEAGLLRDNPPFALAARCLSSIQSVLSGVLLFLIALAARRRFQIS